MEKSRKQRRVYGSIAESMIDREGKPVIPGQEPVYDEPEKEVAQEPVQEPVQEEVVQEPVQEEVVQESVQEEVVEEVAQEEVAEEAAATMDEEQAEIEVAPEIAAAIEEDKEPKIIAKTFAMKMLEADEVLQDRYDELKNYALRFKKLKSRISRKFDSINKGRLQFVKLCVTGKTLKLYLNMDINSVDSKFHCKDMMDKKTYVTVPVLLRIKSGRAVKYAKILIDQAAEFHGLVENKKFQEVDAMALIEESLKNGDDVEALENTALTEDVENAEAVEAVEVSENAETVGDAE